MSLILGQQSFECGQIPARASPLGIGQEGAAQVLQVMDAQVHPDVFIEARAMAVQAEHVHRVAVQAGLAVHGVTQVQIDEKNFGAFGIVAKQGQINVRQARRPAMPDRSAQVRAQGGKVLHPVARMFAQGAKFGGLGVGAKQLDVFTHLRFEQFIAGQSCARAEAQVSQGPLLGRTKAEAFLDHQAGGGGGNFKGELCHAGIVAEAGHGCA